MAKINEKKVRGIYSNFSDWITEKELIESILEQRNYDDEEEEDITEEEIFDEKINLEKIYFNDDVENLDFKTDGRIIAIADLGLWNGRKQGYSIGKNNLNEVMMMCNEDYIRIYQDRFDIRKISSHHDGTNYIMFREIREDRNINNLLNAIYYGEEITRQKLNYYTKSLNHYVDEIFGSYNFKSKK